MISSTSTVDPAEVARFATLSGDWWDADGKFRALHRMNPARIGFIRDEVCRRFGRGPTGDRPFQGLRILDIGCGGGILSEPMARLGADVVGADAAEENVAVARRHAEGARLAIDYRAMTAEALADAGETFDVVLAMEIVEHVADRALFIGACARIVRPGGLLFVATINRTKRAFALAIVAAEYILGWLPRGSHDFGKLVRPEELTADFRANGLQPVAETGIVFDPFSGAWRQAPDMAVNYILAAARPALSMSP